MAATQARSSTGAGVVDRFSVPNVRAFQRRWHQFMAIVWRCVVRARVDPGRVWAWLLLLVGGAISLGANVGHSYIPPSGAVAGWSPSRWSLAWAMAGPLMLFFCVKGLTLVRWPKG